MHDTIKLDTAVSIIAHRGLSGLERENTNAAFVAAGNRSYYGIETDIHRTKDGRFIVFHDDTIERLAGVDGVVEEMTFEELRQLRLRDMDGNIREDLLLPSLEEYIRICKKYGKQSILELKNHFEPADIQQIIAIIQQEGWLEHTTFISFDLPNVLYVRRLLPEQPVQYLVDEPPENLLETLTENRLDLDIYYRFLNPELVSACHEAGVLVNTWTVDSVEDGLRAAQMGVDYITSNILE